MWMCGCVEVLVCDKPDDSGEFVGTEGLRWDKEVRCQVQVHAAWRRGMAPRHGAAWRGMAPRHAPLRQPHLLRVKVKLVPDRAAFGARVHPPLAAHDALTLSRQRQEVGRQMLDCIRRCSGGVIPKGEVAALLVVRLEPKGRRLRGWGGEGWEEARELVFARWAGRWLHALCIQSLCLRDEGKPRGNKEGVRAEGVGRRRVGARGAACAMHQREGLLKGSQQRQRQAIIESPNRTAVGGNSSGDNRKLLGRARDEPPHGRREAVTDTSEPAEVGKRPVKRESLVMEERTHVACEADTLLEEREELGWARAGYVAGPGCVWWGVCVCVCVCVSRDRALCGGTRIRVMRPGGVGIRESLASTAQTEGSEALIRKRPFRPFRRATQLCMVMWCTPPHRVPGMGRGAS